MIASILAWKAKISQINESNLTFYSFLDVDLALVSLLNIGIYLAFKNLLMEALHETLEKRLPYLILSGEDFSKNYGDQKYELVIYFKNLNKIIKLE